MTRVAQALLACLTWAGTAIAAPVDIVPPEVPAARTITMRSEVIPTVDVDDAGEDSAQVRRVFLARERDAVIDLGSILCATGVETFGDLDRDGEPEFVCHAGHYGDGGEVFRVFPRVETLGPCCGY